MILCIGAIGGVYGLHLAVKRQEKFSNQVDVQTAQMQVQADQSFNDRLGRGVELLADEKNVVMRCAGIRVLVDLINNSDKAQKIIVTNIIYDFFRTKASIRYNKNNERFPIPAREGRQDVQNALDFLVSISIDERKKLYPNWLFASQLNFRSLDFSHLDFSNKALKDIDFSHSYMHNTKFDNANIENAEMYNCNIEIYNFYKIKLKQVRFDKCRIKSGRFFDAQITNSSFKYGAIIESSFISGFFEKIDFSNVQINSTDIHDVEIIDVKFQRVHFKWGKFDISQIKVSSNSDLPQFTSTDLVFTKFDFDDEIEPKDFFTLCYYGAKQQLSKMDASRRYHFLEGWGAVFVKSNEDWSEKPVDAWIKRERARDELREMTDMEESWDMMEDQQHYYEDEDAIIRLQQTQDPLEYASIAFYLAEKDLNRAVLSLNCFKKNQSKPKPKPKSKKRPNPRQRNPNPKNCSNHAP